MPGPEPPSVILADCPSCGDETLHDVLHGKVGTRGAYVTLDATVKCDACGATHRTTTQEAKETAIHVVLSKGSQARKTKVGIPHDEEVNVGEILEVDGVNSLVTGIQTREDKRVETAAVPDVLTLWMTEFEERAVPFSINMRRKTVTRSIAAPVEAEFTVGEEHLFGRLRVTVHAIKTKERLLKRGTANAGEIVRIFAKPTHLGARTTRPEKHVREALREKEGRR